jgi:hypothetical protein
VDVATTAFLKRVHEYNRQLLNALRIVVMSPWPSGCYQRSSFRPTMPQLPFAWRQRRQRGSALDSVAVRLT